VVQTIVNIDNSVFNTVSRRIGRWSERFGQQDASLRKFGLFLALCVFGLGLGWAATRVSDALERLTLAPLLVLLLVGVPANVALNAAEFRAMLQVAGRQLPWFPALEVTVYTSAANMLPLPGGVMTKIAAMRVRGVAVRQGSWLAFLFAGVWAGSAFCFSGAAIVLNNKAPGLLFLSVGATALAFSVKWLHRERANYWLIGKIVLIRLSSLTVETARIILALHALGTAVDPFATAVFAVSSFVGTAISVIPAGLGVREGVVALLSPLIGLDPAIGFLSASLSRLADFVVLSLLSVILLINNKRCV